MIDHDAGRHIATLPGFPGVAGAVADDGQILVTNRGSASVALLDAGTLETRAVFKTGARPNGAAIVVRSGLAIAACIGDDGEVPTLQLFRLRDRKHVSIDLPGRPRWCVTDAAAERVFLCIREPSMVLAARLPDLGAVTRWKVPSSGAHGLDIDHSRRLSVCARQVLGPVVHQFAGVFDRRPQRPLRIELPDRRQRHHPDRHGQLSTHEVAVQLAALYHLAAVRIERVVDDPLRRIHRVVVGIA